MLAFGKEFAVGAGVGDELRFVEILRRLEDLLGAVAPALGGGEGERAEGEGAGRRVALLFGLASGDGSRRTLDGLEDRLGDVLVDQTPFLVEARLAFLGLPAALEGAVDVFELY